MLFFLIFVAALVKIYIEYSAKNDEINNRSLIIKYK